MPYNPDVRFFDGEHKPALGKACRYVAMLVEGGLLPPGQTP